MFRSRKTLFAVLGSLVVAIAMIAGAVAVAAPQVALAQSPSPTPNTPSTGTTTTNSTVQKYWDLFWNNFAQQLGLTVDKVKTGFTAAMDATIDQAVKDGILSQATGDALKARLGTEISQGPSASGNFPFLFGRGFGFAFKGGRGGSYGIQLNLGTAEFAKALNMTEQDLITALRAGKSINDVAKEKNIDPATVKSTVLADVKTQLDAAVSSGAITQAQADTIYSNVSSKIDAIMSENEANEPHGKWGFPNNNGSSGNNGSNPGRRFGEGL